MAEEEVAPVCVPAFLPPWEPESVGLRNLIDWLGYQSCPLPLEEGFETLFSTDTGGLPTLLIGGKDDYFPSFGLEHLECCLPAFRYQRGSQHVSV